MKCVSGYDACVKANGADALSRLSCGVGYLKCRFSNMVSEDKDVMLDDSTSVSSNIYATEKLNYFWIYVMFNWSNSKMR